MMSLFRNRLFIGAILLVMLAIVGRVIWNRAGHLVVGDPRFQLKESMLVVNEQPDWIQSNVKKSAIRFGKLDELSLLDRELVSKVDEAFRVQNWVSDVKSVRKTPQGVSVELEYRKPVAMVEIVTDGSAKLQPVDGNGVLLPGAEFSQSQAMRYIRIAVPSPRLHGLIDGTVWPDERVVHASKVANFIAEDADALGLFRIDMMLADRQAARRSPVFEIQTRNGQRIVWGSAPGDEVDGEAAASERMDTLRTLKPALQSATSGQAKTLYDIRTGTVVRIQDPSNIASEDQPRGNSNPWNAD